MASKSFSLTETLLSSDPAAWKAATQSQFLEAAAKGTLSKKVLGTWLANDRLYIHSYIKSAGCLLSLVDLPQLLPMEETTEMKLADWICDALVAIRKEERWFNDAARRYGLDVHLETSSFSPDEVKEEAKLPGLVMFERLFARVPPLVQSTRPQPLPWLEGAVIFWGTERVYLEAWSWAKSQMPEDMQQGSYGNDADGGAARTEFISNWTSAEFKAVVDKLGYIIDESIQKLLTDDKHITEDKIMERVKNAWDTLLASEAAFWPGLLNQ